MKTNQLKQGQLWRCIALAAQVLALIVMAIPGSYVWCGIEEIYYDASYLQPDPYGGIWMWLAFGTAVLVALIQMIVCLRRKSGVISLLLTLIPGAALLWMEKMIPLEFAAQAIRHGTTVWLPFLPPILSALSLTAAVIAWFVGRKEA